MSADYRSLPRRDLPALNERNRFFWQSGADGKLRFSQCCACGYYIHPSAPICAQCKSRDISPAEVSGRATVLTFTINRQVWQAGLEAPFVVAIVEMEEQEGLRLTTNIVNCAVEDVHIGQAVRVIFDHREDVWLPLFEPDLHGGGSE